ncbi:NAD(P)-dependent oxidoreductase [Fundicoccus sp. Sow4_D5]|uniref:NAD(P)-dependent oxidoreductase n=1 Tax=unclassified Fundicoccus TaxID=2761543 RepID=UPI003F93D922
MTKVGFVGLGVMGNSMAKHLLAAGHELFVYNRTQAKADELVSLGAKRCSTPKEVAHAADVVMTIVGYPQDVEEVYFSQEGLFAGVHSNSLFIDLTTSTPSLAIKIAETASRHGIKSLDAPVSGGDLGAREARLTTMVGGDKATFDEVKPLLDVFSAKVTLQGSAGAGQHTKMANQIMIAGTMTGMIELLVYAKTAGLDLETVLDTVGGGAAANWSLANYAPRILKGDYTPGFFAKHFLKDLKIALDEAEKMEISLPGAELAAKLYQKLCDEGYGDEGTQALIKLWEKFA